MWTGHGSDRERSQGFSAFAPSHVAIERAKNLMRVRRQTQPWALTCSSWAHRAKTRLTAVCSWAWHRADRLVSAVRLGW